ncbi:MAG: glycosyltransferase [Desulfobacterales bacterium]|nr:glycosyltransferase [Desulfobacterales bacterium]
MRPLVSVITPIYNGSLYLDDAVESVLNQTYDNWELFLIDDGSADDSYEKAKDWSEKDKRIIAFHHPGHVNKGVSATRNLGINHAKGQYVAMLDCDDEWLPGKLEKQVGIILRHPQTVMVYCQAESIDEEGIPLRLNPKKIENCPHPPVYGKGLTGGPFDAFELMVSIREIQTACLTVLARAEDVRNCGGFDETMEFQMEDALLFALLAERSPVFFLDEILARYRFHDSSWSASLDHRKTAMTNLEYSDRLLKAVKPEHRLLCSQELVNRWARFVIGPGYWSPRADISLIISSLFWVFRHKKVRPRDKARCCWILMRWVGWKFLKISHFS